MSDKLQGGIKADSTSVSWTVVLRKSADSTEQTGKVAADMTGSYMRQGSTRTSISLSDLASVNSAYSSGGVKEVDSTNMPGLYRLDLPDAAVASGADWVMVSIKVASTFVFFERIPLTTNVIQTGDSFVRLPAALVSGRIDASVGAMAANVLTATAINADAITDAKVAADVTIASVTGAVGSVTGAVGSVTGNVGGNVVGSVASVTNAVTLTGAYDFAKGTTAMTEAYAANGVAPTPVQALFSIQQMLQMFAIAGTNLTVKKLDNSTTAFVVTLNDAVNPTGAART